MRCAVTNTRMSHWQTKPLAALCISGSAPRPLKVRYPATYDSSIFWIIISELQFSATKLLIISNKKKQCIVETQNFRMYKILFMLPIKPFDFLTNKEKPYKN